MDAAKVAIGHHVFLRDASSSTETMNGALHRATRDLPEGPAEGLLNEPSEIRHFDRDRAVEEKSSSRSLTVSSSLRRHRRFSHVSRSNSRSWP